MDDRVIVRVPRELKEALKELAKRDRRGFADYVRLALEYHVKAQKKGVAR